MTPTREDFAELSPADFMDKVEAETAERRRKAEGAEAAWDAQCRSDTALPLAARRRRLWVLAIIAGLIAFAAIVLGGTALPARAHDKAAWSDPARDEWYRSLKVPGRNTSCCNLHDADPISLDRVKQDSGGVWWVDLGNGFVPVPADRVVTTPPSIDGLPYIFLMAAPTADSPNGIRCFSPPVGTY